MILREIDNLWEANNSFKDKLRSWLDQIKLTQQRAAEMRQYFHQWRPLSAYVKAGNKTGKDLFSFSLRFLGQEVASLIVRGSDVYLNVSDKTAQTNNRFFQNLIMPAGTYGWRGKKAQYFRRYFQDVVKKDSIGLHSPEHMIESRIIKEMFSKSRKKFGGAFSGIQPVTLSGFPLQFPLPISGSSGTPKATNGHIDILARRRAGRVCLSVWELKAPGKYKNTLREVYIYSTTLLKMLRDPDLGQEWYKIFGFSGKIPAVLCIEAVLAVTGDQRKRIAKEKADHNLLKHIGNDRIDFFAAYYDKDTLKIKYEKI